jgi:FixJ family two-component response regulator
MPRVLLVDDDANVLSALRRALLPILPPDSVVEFHTDPAAALERALAQEFDIVVADYRMPGMNGVELLRALRDRYPGTIRLMLSGVSDFSVILDAVNSAQIFHYICKPWEAGQLREVFGKALEQRQAHLESSGDQAVAEDTHARLAALTAREREVMQLMVEGKPSKVIARELGISARTVENHRARVMEKSGAKTLTELVKMTLQKRRSGA